jgi:hypothetical protein
MSGPEPPKYYVPIHDESNAVEQAIPPLDIPTTPTKVGGSEDILQRISTKWNEEDQQVYAQYQRDKKQCVDMYLQQHVIIQENLRRDMVEVHRRYHRAQETVRLQRKQDIQQTLDQRSTYSSPSWYHQVRQWWPWS